MRRYLALMCVICLGFSLVPTINAQSRSIFWDRWDVVIDEVDTEANSFDVSEQYQITFDGTFQFGTAVIPDDRLENIDNVQVFQDGQPLQESGCVDDASRGRGTFCVRNTTEGTQIIYNFFSPLTNETASFTLDYTVTGALRVYEDGDQLWWVAIPEEKFGFAVGESTITVEMPQDSIPREAIDPVVTYGASADVSVQGNVVTAVATQPIGPSESFEIRVQYPHDSDAVAPAWQADFDDQRAFDENILPWINLIVIALSLLLAIAGPLGVFSLWYNKGRDPKVGPVPTYLETPPSDLSPSVAGALLDEKADIRDIMAGLIDLSRRGYVVIEEEKKEGFFGLGGGSEFAFKRTDKPDSDLNKFERELIKDIFGSKMERSMDSLKEKFYKHIPGLQAQLYSDLVEADLFSERPSTTRNKYSGIGVFVVATAGFIGVLLFQQIDQLPGVVLGIPVAVVLTGLALIILGQYMPAKTRKGALEAAKWNAFREYLKNIDRYTEVEAATKQFDRYLPYAIAFNLERSWIRRFSKIDHTPMPTWYFPTYRGGRYSGGYRPGTPIRDYIPSPTDGLPGDIAQAGGSGMSLDTMATDFSAGLESMASGLSDMLESASSTMTSKPSSDSSGSWGSGGSSFSGGGSFGGGGSGGGSRGFG